MSFFIILFSKILNRVLRLLRIGGGTSLPGYIIERRFSHVITSLTNRYKKIILITGTNGKTTTQQLLRHLLEHKNFSVTSNKSGANLIRGIATSIITDTNLFGKVTKDIAVFEVEEATMPKLASLLRADYIIVTNLYRDQLDAYGEVTKTREYILNAIQKQEDAILFLLGDDENVSSIANTVDNEVKFFTINDTRIKNIFYERTFVQSNQKHTGSITAHDISIHSDLTTSFSLTIDKTSYKDIPFSSPGIHYIYNAIAAIGVACDITTFNNQKLRIAFEKFHPAFGRGEIIKIGDKTLRMLLIKNPASFTANINMLNQLHKVKLFIIINDNIADGKDVSWLWDAKLEQLPKSKISWITVSGTRAYDMALRLKYAGFGTMNIEVESNMSKAIDISLQKLNQHETLFIMPTYTAMLDVRKKLSKRVPLKKFWK